MPSAFFQRLIRAAFVAFRLTALTFAGLAFAGLSAHVFSTSALAAEAPVVLPAPDLKIENMAKSETAVLAGGCFWGVQAVFQHVKGVKNALSGYAGGKPGPTSYRQVSTGTTGHAEAVKITFDPQIISYGDILRIYFSVAHNPTQLNRQGPDRGTQYRSEIFTTSEAQKKIAEAYIAQLDKGGFFPEPIVTRVEDLSRFHDAEDYHQDYATLHPTQPYIAYHDLPKIENLKRLFAAYYREKPVLVNVMN